MSQSANALIFRFFALALFLLLPLSALAQPTLESLWPNEDGKSWSYAGSYQRNQDPVEFYTARLIFEGTGIFPPGVEVQNLIGQIDGIPVAKVEGMPDGLSPLLRQVWVARPDLREAITQRADKHAVDFWPSLLLGPAELTREVGHRQTPDFIGIWRQPLADWSWWYLSDELFAGASFTLQLIPDLASDVYLHGTVRGTAEGISVPAGDWSNATVVDYVIDYGVSDLVNESGEVIGTVEPETSGWVAFVPDVGPVASIEEYSHTSVDCPGGCPMVPPAGTILQTVELSLVSLPVATTESSWGSLKASY